MTAFESFKTACNAACHDRHACANGYRAMLAAENVGQLMAVWRDNWDDLVESKYADIINEKLPAFYPELKEDMNAAGIYVNECPAVAPEFVMVIVTDFDYDVNVYDYAKCFVLGRAHVCARDHAQVYSEKNDDCVIHLFGHSYGHASKGRVVAYDFSRLCTSTDAALSGCVRCEAHGGDILAYDYLKIEAYGNTKVFARSDSNISLYGNAQFVALY
jgi:hypothetical protein